MSLGNKNLVKSGIASAALHSLVIAFGFLNIFEPKINNDMFLNIELAGAAEMQQALDDYNNHSIIENPQLKSETFQPEEIQKEQLPKDPIQEPEPKYESPPEKQPIEDSNIVESQPESEEELDPQLETDSEIEEPLQESGEVLPQELKNEEALRLEKLEKEKLEKEENLRKEREEKLRLEKKKKEAARRRKKRLEAIKRIEKKNKAKKRRLAKIADAVKKNNEARKKQDDSFSKMLKNEKKGTGRFSKSTSRSGNGNGLGSYGDGMGFVDSDAAIISNQIIPHWVVAGGVKNAESLIIRMRIKVKDNGEVLASSIEILDKDRYNLDAVFKSAADSAKRAVLKASPLKIPAEKMHLFRNFEISFNTDKALGVKK